VVASIDAATLREVMARYAEALRTHRDEIDSLNIFPVPDGDTGTNMLLTQEAVRTAAEEAGEDLAAMGEAISRAALMAARGNSGVILSQVLRGFCARLCRAEAPGPRDLAEALVEASDEAFRAVAHPVEGTMLSVLRDAAAAGRAVAENAEEPAAVATEALAAAQESLERTPEQLPDLRAAGVVDAGGKGIVLLMDAIVSVLTDSGLSVEVGELGPVGHEEGLVDDDVRSSYGYEVQYLLETADDAVAGLRVRLESLGDSLVIVGGDGLYNVHLHTDDPDVAVQVAHEEGEAQSVSVVSLTDQVAERCLAGQARAVRVAEQPEAMMVDGEEEAPVAVVAVTPAEGIARLFRSLGALTVRGGPGRNPSVAELLGAIEETRAQSVLLLPNHKNVVPAAEQAARAAGRPVHVVATRSVHEGLAAATAFNPTVGAGENLRGAEEAVAGVVSAEVARAVRAAETPAGRVLEGQFLGITNGEVHTIGDDPGGIARELIGQLVTERHEVLTLLSGSDVTNVEAETLAGSLREAFPNLEVELHEGGQANYPYLIGLE
jgi:hypothetical protein